jgi:4-hydroxy-3-polyprenylbenzoate decarboxylase
VAVVIGASPNIGYTAVNKIPYGIDEYSIAGGIAGEPVELVKCKTVDIEVPATAQIVLEGELPTDHFEQEGPFGEYTGYVGTEGMNLFFNVRCITHQRNPIYTGFTSGFPPSESTVMIKLSYEALYYKFLKHDCNIPSILDVAFYESAGVWQFCVIQMKKTHFSQPWQALNAAIALEPQIGKTMIVVDEDIDPRDPEAVIWALSFSMQPHQDTRITQGKAVGLDPSAAPMAGRVARLNPTSALLIDATRKWDYPPVSLPKKEFMERARRLWDEIGLPPFTPKVPWYGYSLGYWTEENEEEARLAVMGRYYETGEKLARKRMKI